MPRYVKYITLGFYSQWIFKSDRNFQFSDKCLKNERLRVLERFEQKELFMEKNSENIGAMV